MGNTVRIEILEDTVCLKHMYRLYWKTQIHPRMTQNTSNIFTNAIQAEIHVIILR